LKIKTWPKWLWVVHWIIKKIIYVLLLIKVINMKKNKSRKQCLSWILIFIQNFQFKKYPLPKRDIVNRSIKNLTKNQYTSIPSTCFNWLICPSHLVHETIIEWLIYLYPIIAVHENLQSHYPIENKWNDVGIMSYFLSHLKNIYLGWLLNIIMYACYAYFFIFLTKC
jgi:hypothetical protein